MVSRAAVLAKASEWVGMREQPDGSNNIEFSRDWGITGQSWCFAFVQSCFYYADPSPSGALPHQSMYCPYGIQWARDNGQAIEVGGSPVPGDIVFFSWDMAAWPRNRPGTGDHVGIVTGWDGGDWITTIEGNIGSPQGVWEKDRSISQTVVCFWRPTVYDDGTFGIAAIPKEEDMTPDQERTQNETRDLVRWLKDTLAGTDAVVRDTYNYGIWNNSEIKELKGMVAAIPTDGGSGSAEAAPPVDVDALIRQATAAQLAKVNPATLIAALNQVFSAPKPPVAPPAADA